MIVRVKKGYKVVSHQTRKSFGTYPSRAQAEARLAQIRRFR
jgi:hypothetical protein